MAQTVRLPHLPQPLSPENSNDLITEIRSEEIIIRQKGDKDTKITLEIKNGDYFINGKPLEKFDDKILSLKKGKQMTVITMS